VPYDLSFEQQVAIASGAAQEAAALYSESAPATAGGIGGIAEGVGSSFECGALAQEVIAIDTATRSPQSGQMQDFWRQRRMAVRSRQASLRC
jgi:hypothetical protein